MPRPPDTPDTPANTRAARAVPTAQAQLSLFDETPADRSTHQHPMVAVAPPAVESRRSHPPAAPSIYRHPRASRELCLMGQWVGFELRRARRRSIGFVVGVEGLSVSAPRWVGVGDIEKALHDKAPWIMRKLGEQAQRAHKLEAARIDWRDGATVPYLGETVVLVLDPRVNGAVLQGPGIAGLQAHDGDAVNMPAAGLPGMPRLTLHLGLPQHAAPAQIRETVQSWLQREARRVFEARCAHFAAILGVKVTRLSLSSAQTRWGSASSNGSVRLNWRLIHFAMPTIDYVVTHELAHLREMNHSAAFWDVVRSAMPDFETARASLRTDVVPKFD